MASWYFQEWARYTGAASADVIAARLAGSRNRDRIPLMVLATEDTEVIGAAELKYREMSIYPEKEHWLGGVFVSREYRGRGVASTLIERVVEIAEWFRVEVLHLQTARLGGGLYSRLRWSPFEQANYRGREVLAMRRQFGVRPS